MISRRNVILCSLSLSLLAVPSEGAGLPDEAQAEMQKMSAQLAGSIVVGGRSLDYLEALTDQFGARLTGSGSYQRAAAWAMGELRAAGLKDARLESFKLASGWERGSAEGRVLAPLERPLHVLSVAWSPSTPKGGVRGEVAMLADVDPKKLEAEAGRLKGRIVLLDGGKLFKEPRKIGQVVDQLAASYPMLQQMGVLGILWAGSRPNNVIKAGGKFRDGRLGNLPAADIGLEDFKLIERLLEKGPVRVEFRLENKTRGPVEVPNVIAELRGREKPDEWVLVTAHLDSWDFATGAQDNGTGTAMVLEAARAIAGAGQPPRRSLRFILWGGEEQGLLGSRAYVNAHQGELDRVVAVLNTDSGAGAPRGWVVGEREDLMTALKPVSRGLLRGLGGTELSPRSSCDSDHASFIVRGVPAMTLWMDGEHYPDIHHLGSDTFDKVSPGNLAAGSAIVAVTAFALAERPERIAPRLGGAALDALLEKADLVRCKKEAERAQ